MNKGGLPPKKVTHQGPLHPFLVTLLEGPMQTEKDRAALLAENSKLRKENEYLVHRIAYMESLAKLMGFNLGNGVPGQADGLQSGQHKKKNASKPSISSSSPKERGT